MKLVKLLPLGTALAAVVLLLGLGAGLAAENKAPDAKAGAQNAMDPALLKLVHDFGVAGLDIQGYKAPLPEDGKASWTRDWSGPVTGLLASISGKFRALAESHSARWIYPVSQPWMDSGLKLEKGKTYWIHISGIAGTAFSKSYLWLGPEGTDPGYENVKGDPEPRLPRYAMIGKLGLKGIPFWIGSSLEITPESTETLYLGYTDDMYTDNRGYYVVDLFADTKAKVQAELKASGTGFTDFSGD